MNELALFAGAGGGLLGSQYLGWRTICAVELNWYCRCILVERQNNRELSSIFPIWDDICTFDGKPWRNKIDVISGGFPCQAYSTAAAGKNNADDLWPEMLRIVADVSPRYVYAENVSKRAIEYAAQDCRKLNYKTRTIKVSASDVGADHIRARYWLLAYADDPRKLLCGFNAEASMLQELAGNIWGSNPTLSGMDDGMAYRMDRIKATGNGQVPLSFISAIVQLTEEK